MKKPALRATLFLRFRGRIFSIDMGADAPCRENLRQVNRAQHRQHTRLERRGNGVVAMDM